MANLGGLGYTNTLTATFTNTATTAFTNTFTNTFYEHLYEHVYEHLYECLYRTFAQSEFVAPVGCSQRGVRTCVPMSEHSEYVLGEHLYEHAPQYDAHGRLTPLMQRPSQR